MIDTSKLTTGQIRRAGMDAVVREVGVVGLVRLMRDDGPLQGNYATDRDTLRPQFESVDAMMEALTREGAPEAK